MNEWIDSMFFHVFSYLRFNAFTDRMDVMFNVHDRLVDVNQRYILKHITKQSRATVRFTLQTVDERLIPSLYTAV